MQTKSTNTIRLQKISPLNARSVMDVQKILQGKKKIALYHEGKKYILQITSNNKLLLTK